MFLFICNRLQELPADKVFTRRQGEFFIAQQASLLEKDEAKALPPDILQQQISALQESNPDLTETVRKYFLCFFFFFGVGV